MTSKNTYILNAQTFEMTLLPKNPIFEKSQAIRIYETPKGLWIANALSGVAFLSHNLDFSNTSTFYNDYFISGVFYDNEGNTLLSTFDKGVLVIPDLKVPDVIHSFRDDPITTIRADTHFGLVLSSSKGILSAYSKNIFSNINNEGKRPIEAIYGDENSPLILFDNGSIRAYNKKTNKIINIIEASLKDAVFISATEFYIATNRGVIKCVFDNENNIRSEWQKDLRFRIYALEYNPNKKLLYVASSNGLFSVDNAGIIQKIMHKNQDVFSQYLHYNNGKLYVPTSKNGILIIENNNITDSIRPNIAGKIQELNKIIIHQNTIIAKSSNGFFQFDMNGNLLKSLHTIFGFSSFRVVDFAFQGNNLWVSHSGGVQEIDLAYKNPNQLKPVVNLSEILVNDKIISINTSKTTENDFNSTQRKIQFTLSSPTLRHSETTQYHYKLIGYDTKWNINNFAANQLAYNALASGEYTFLVKVENQGVFSDVISYSFNISKPIYAKWWFIAISITFFLILVLIIYLWQLGVQRKKSQQINELNASKLAAIQSQMNPHFIFNALNSIQDLVLKGDVEQSYSYITTFSNLVRRTLNYSEKEFIDFEQEIKLLELYLTLEKLRFKKDLTYKIINANFDDIMLPPLLIQPFIENSLLHGLLHKEGKKELIITFELKENLICTIEDNGIGREKSKEIKNRQNQSHESFSGKAIHKRFEILSNLFKGDFGYHYEDLYQNDLPSGTKVILNIPVKRKF